ncbi:hypothetical protein RQP46_007588 [Phenoliferia psychrophenolica]
MEGDAAPPRQLPEASVGALDSPSPSDSAPPPRSVSPLALPPKDYFTQSVGSAAIPQTLRPNSTIPAFLRFLSIAIFLGGTAIGAGAWIYRTILYPRLVLALAARTQLHLSHLTSYDRLLEAVRGLGKGPGYQLIAPRPTIIEPPVVVEPPPSPSKEAAPAPASEEDVTTPSPPPPAILLPLSTSLRTLSTALTPAPIHTVETTTASSPTIPLKPSAALESSLAALSDYLAAETLASMSAAYRTQVPTTDGAGRDQKKLAEAVASLKSEIRQVKGALLNRRNFAALVPLGSHSGQAVR